MGCQGGPKSQLNCQEVHYTFKNGHAGHSLDFRGNFGVSKMACSNFKKCTCGVSGFWGSVGGLGDCNTYCWHISLGPGNRMFVVLTILLQMFILYGDVCAKTMQVDKFRVGPVWFASTTVRAWHGSCMERFEGFCSLFSLRNELDTTSVFPHSFGRLV